MVGQQFLGRDIDHIGCVQAGPELGLDLRMHRSQADTAGRIQILHGLRIALGQVVVGGDHMAGPTAPAGQHRRQRDGQRLALAGGHLGQPAVVQGQSAHHLHRVGPHAQHAARLLAHQGQRLQQLALSLQWVAPQLLLRLHKRLRQLCIV